MKTQDLLSCQRLSGVGERMAGRLARMDILTLSDLLFHLPMRYEDRTCVSRIRDLQLGVSAVIDVTIESVTFPLSGRTRLQVQARDASGQICLRFFHVYPKQRQLLSAGVRLRCYGEPRWGSRGMEMFHPEYQTITTIDVPAEQVLTPVYPTTEGVSQAVLRKWIKEALQITAAQDEWNELLPAPLLQQMNFPTLQQALRFAHFPPAGTPLEVLAGFRHITQQRLIFEELLAHRLGLLEVKKQIQVLSATPFTAADSLVQQFFTNLPYSLTGAQQKVWSEICADVSLSKPMLRLVQGDVGCGKTIVAALAVLKAVENNTQAAVLAPTELLAEQHFQVFKQWFQPLGIDVAMLSSQLKTADRRRILAGVGQGDIKVLIGTHAIFQKEVVFSNLALMVVDEQHRFGVQQRMLLREKGVSSASCPHQLVLTATPIPRTLAMSVYADLDYSVIDELPPGRLPIVTRLMPESRRTDIFQRLREACLAGRQAYWVCTRIEGSEELDSAAAEEMLVEMRSALPTLQIGMVHGRMKSVEKEHIMSTFREGLLQVLIATTVIEVGVDVPSASVMVIENAERLGLAQLHQLRGRVGRGKTGGFCVLLYRAPLSAHARERLAVMRETVDGFKIAQRDLELRGPGEVLGVRQTGDVSFKIADLMRDSDLLPQVQQVADQLLQCYPKVASLLIRRWVGSREGYGVV